MLSSKVDLTDNRDFSNHDSLFDHLFLDGDVVARAIRVNSMDTISNEDYQAIIEYERVFGIKLHTDQSWEILHSKDELMYMEEMMTHCQRCGKEFRVPWKNYGGLCEECNDVLEKTNDQGKIKFPWSIIERASFGRGAEEIFSMR